MTATGSHVVDKVVLSWDVVAIHRHLSSSVSIARVAKVALTS